VYVLGRPPELEGVHLELNRTPVHQAGKSLLRKSVEKASLHALNGIKKVPSLASGSYLSSGGSVSK
jgi:hypothetical protein